MWIKTIIICCVGLLSYNGSAQSLIILDSCQQQAKKNYPLIRQYDLIEKSTEYTINNANKAYLPQVNITGVGGAVFGAFPGSGTSNLKFIGFGTISQALWDGGATKAQKSIAKASAQIDKASLDVQMYAIRDRVNQLYFGILLIDEQIKQLDSQLELLHRNLKRLQELNSSGLVIKNDLNMAQAEILGIQERKTEFSFTRKSYVYLLSLFTAKPLPEDIKVAVPDMVVPEQKISRPELQLYEKQSKLLEAQNEMNNVKLMPKIGLLGAGALITPGISFGQQSVSSIALAGLSVSWELAGFYTHSSNKELHKVNQEKIQNQEDTFLFNTNMQARHSNTEIEKYKALEQYDNELVDLRKRIRENYQQQYDSGSCPFSDFLTASTKETDAAANKALHHVQLLLNIYQYNNITGN